MMSEKQELVGIIKKAGLPEADQKEWEFLINSSPGNYTRGLLKLFRKFPDEVSWFNSIYKRKKEAFSKMRSDRTGGKTLFQKIVQEERERLDKIVSRISD